jgi:hypothetical protein
MIRAARDGMVGPVRAVLTERPGIGERGCTDGQSVAGCTSSDPRPVRDRPAATALAQSRGLKACREGGVTMTAVPQSEQAHAGEAAERPASAFARVDGALYRLARAVARVLPARILTIALIAIGSLLIWLGAKPVAMLTLLFNGIDCRFPSLGKWLSLSCAQAPTWHGFSLLTAGLIAAWLALYALIWVAIWLLGRLFVGFSSRIVLSDLVRIKTGIPRKVLIMGLSAADAELAIAEAQEWSAQAAVYAGGAAAWKLERAKRGSDPAVSAAAGGWQQAARMVQAHLAGSALMRIYVLPSYETKSALASFRTYLETLFGRTFDVRAVTDEGGEPFADRSEASARERQSYDNYLYLRDGLWRAVEQAKQDSVKQREGRLSDSDICIDATAGFKLLSIAAAVVTFDRNIVLGYVVTGGGRTINPEEGVVKLFDPRIEFVSAARNKVLQSAFPGL